MCLVRGLSERCTRAGTLTELSPAPRCTTPFARLTNEGTKPRSAAALVLCGFNYRVVVITTRTYSTVMVTENGAA